MIIETYLQNFELASGSTYPLWAPYWGDLSWLGLWILPTPAHQYPSCGAMLQPLLSTHVPFAHIGLPCGGWTHLLSHPSLCHAPPSFRIRAQHIGSLGCLFAASPLLKSSKCSTTEAVKDRGCFSLIFGDSLWVSQESRDIGIKCTWRQVSGPTFPCQYHLEIWAQFPFP